MNTDVLGVKVLVVVTTSTKKLNSKMFTEVRISRGSIHGEHSTVGTKAVLDTSLLLVSWSLHVVH